MTPAAPVPGFVVGLAVEAQALARGLAQALAPDLAPPPIACAGASAGRARQGARRLLAEGAGALLSFGIAGGLDPALAPGDLVLPERIAAAGRPPIACDPDLRAQWLAAAAAAGLGALGGSLLDSAAMVATVADKRALFSATGCVATDMESRAVADVAAEAGVPFAAARAVANPAGRSLPRAVRGIIGPAGRPRPAALVLRLCLRPWEVPAVVRLGRDAEAGLASLGRLAGGFRPAGLA